MRYEIGKDFNTKDWFVYDNEVNMNICWCDTEKEAKRKVKEFEKEDEKMKYNAFGYSTNGKERKITLNERQLFNLRNIIKGYKDELCGSRQDITA